MRTKALTAVVASVTAALTLAGPAATAASPSAEAEPVVLRVGTISDLITANPWGVSAGSDWSVSTLQYDLLLEMGSRDLSPEPSLAEGCDHSDDYMTWTCTLRDGLRWSDGTPLTARDVAFTYRFVIDNKIPQYRGYFPFHPTFRTPDPRTLIWRSSEPTFAPAMPPWVYIVPEKVWAPYDGKGLPAIKSVENVPAITSGPFMLTDWRQGQGWTMDRNPEYWGTQPTVDRIEFRLYSNQEAMIQALRNGEIDFADGIAPSLVSSVEGIPDVKVQKVLSDWWLNLAFNFGGQGPDANPLPALKDHRVRQAIAMAIDKETIAEKVYAGTATPGDTVIRPASAFWHLDIPADQELPFDPTAANALLDEAGYADTDDDGVREDPATGEPLEMLIPASKDTTGAVEAGQLIVGFLKQIGITVHLSPVSDAKMGDYWGAGNFDAYIWYWTGDPDPNYQLSVFTSGQCGGYSDGCWKDPTFDHLYEEQRGIMDRNERLKVVQEAQRYIYDQIPGVVLAYPGWLQAYRTDRFQGWIPAPGPHGYLMPGYNYESVVALKPVLASAGSSAASGLVPGWMWLVAIGAFSALFFLTMKRNRRRELERA